MSFGPPGHSSAGWVAYRTDTPGLYAFARLAKDENGALVVRDLLVSADEHLSATDLQAVKLGQIERQINALPMSLREAPLSAPQERDEFIEAFRRPAPHGMVTKDKRPKQGRPKLSRPSGEDPNVFYARVAEAYRSASSETSKPGPLLAEEAGVPVATARRWIAEARRRGHLPPGRKGKAG